MPGSLPLRRRRALLALFASALLLSFALVPAQPDKALGVTNLNPTTAGLEDRDFRTGSVSPNATQKSMANKLGAHVTWNRFGTPASLIKYGGYLAKGVGGSEVNAARSWLRSKAALFRLTGAEVDNLELVNDSVMAAGGGHAVMFRQRFGSLSATQDGFITVGIKKGNIAYVSSSAAGNQGSPAAATLTPQQAWARAANHIGRSAGSIGAARQENGWTVFPASNFRTPTVELNGKTRSIDQRARLVALPTYTQGVKAAYEVNILHNKPGDPVTAYIMFVDARSGAILFRHNAVDEAAAGMALQAADSGFFTGTTGTNPDNDLCGPDIEIEVVRPVDNRIDVVATADVPADDIIIDLFRPDDSLAAHGDTLFSPEAVDYALTPSDPSGTWYARVCEFEEVPDFDYTGFFQVSPVATPPVFAFPPQWNYFRANPPMPTGTLTPPYNYPNTDNRTHGCWTTTDPGAPPGCDLDLTPNAGDTNLASRVPWDHNVQSNLPNFQTDGNNAFTAEAWFAALTPGATSQRPIDFDRTYGFAETNVDSPTGPFEGWTNQWNKSRCAPASLTVAGNNNDVLAATTSLHAGHNRAHDWAYHLGFTERNFNMQVNNFGNTAPGPFPFGRELDPEIGNVQNGAALPAALGLTRDNANQITLQDGIPGITNQYLFQPIAGAFYAPCADGDLDASIWLHEYTHAISNRMAAGPDQNLSGPQAGAMGESWSDLVAVEYLNAYNYVPVSDENPFSVGAYATGNKQRAIRNYGMNHSPLNYSDIAYDIVGQQVHADGEIWSATNFDIRQILNQKYNGAFPAGSAALQKRCADGNLPADKCPGNRRWIQIMFDAWLLQQSDTSMLTARDAYLAADQLRFGGANQTQLWRVFARRGMGMCSLDPTHACHATRSAFTNGNTDAQPRPSFESPLESEKAVNFYVRSTVNRAAIPADIYVGRYEARVTPIADTRPGGPLSNTARFVSGTYDLLVKAEGYGYQRYRLAASGTDTSDVTLYMSPNYASATNGATATGAGTEHNKLIDDTEATTWSVADTGTGGVNVDQPQVTVDLMGSDAKVVRSVKVSAMLEAPPAVEPRFTALRQFRIDACNAAAPANKDCSNPANFTAIYTSPENAFNAVAPRPVAPDLLGKYFDVPDTAATHVRLVALNNQCTGGPDYEGEQDNDPLNSTDCSAISTRYDELHVAELQVFPTGIDDSTNNPPAGPKDPVVVLTKTGPLTAAKGSNIVYNISYTNLGPATASSAKVIDTLPAGVTFVEASNGGTYNATKRTVTWNVGNVAAGTTGTRALVVKVPSNMATGTLLLNQVEFKAPLTISTPGAFLTLVQ